VQIRLVPSDVSWSGNICPRISIDLNAILLREWSDERNVPASGSFSSLALFEGGFAMPNLTAASNELFSRSPDERFKSLASLWEYCHAQKEQSTDVWRSPAELCVAANGGLKLMAGTDGFYMNGWSFGQLCRLANVSRDTVNRLTPNTARMVFEETMPRDGKPMQLLTQDDRVRSIHGTQYTRLWNADLVMMLREFATDFEPPQEGVEGGTGLYAGEQDLFCFMIDPLGWTEIEGENFAPGFFVWNSEVGRRSLGVTTFWFQAVCQNHIVWDAVEVIEWRRKHTARVNDGLADIRKIVEGLVAKRDARKDGFVEVIRKAMSTKVADDADRALKVLNQKGITRSLAKKAIEIAKQSGALTVWAVVDALTRIASETENAGDRTEADEKSAKLLSLV